MLEKLKKELNYSVTDNGAVTNKSSMSKVLDYFAQGSALRYRNETEIFNLFEDAFKEDALLTMKILFYSRDIRGGQGERNTFKIILRYLAKNHTQVLEKNIELISEFGRWDDLYVLFGTKLESKVIEVIKVQLDKDIKADNPSLLGKWLKSENTSSKESRILASKTRVLLGLSSKEYRKMLSELRAKIDIIETKLTMRSYEGIDYTKVPAIAGLKYRKALYDNDYIRYSKFLEQLTSGEIKANIATISPYELVRAALKRNLEQYEKNLLNSMWRDLPDYINNNAENNIAVVDTSGSMSGNPINVAVSLGIYLAEKSTGAFKNHFITFANKPELVELLGDTFCEKVRNIIKASWGMSTNIEATFDIILNTSIKHKLNQDELPSRIFIISDMEFNEISGGRNVVWNESLFESLTKRFEGHGYKMPKLVFWNVNSRNNNVPMRMDDNVQLVSGTNPVLFETLLKGEFLGAHEIMLNEIGKDRYKCVII